MTIHSGKRYVIGGGAGGVGTVLCKLLKKEGAVVLPLDRKTGFNLSLPDDVESAFRAIDRQGYIDGYVSLVYGGGGDTGFLETGSEELEAVYRATFLAALLPIQRAVKSIILKGGGNIVVVSSVNSILGLNEFSYDAAKGAVNAIARDVAVAHGKDGIHAVTLCPGTICGTPSWEGKEKDLKRIASWIPDGKVTTAEEVAQTISFLLSKWGNMFSGSTLVADRGWHLKPVFKK